jgi:hypothetical protein
MLAVEAFLTLQQMAHCSAEWPGQDVSAGCEVLACEEQAPMKELQLEL